MPPSVTNGAQKDTLRNFLQNALLTPSVLKRSVCSRLTVSLIEMMPVHAKGLERLPTISAGA